MSIKKDIVEAEFRTSGGHKVQKEINAITGTIAKTTKQNERLKKSMAKLEAQGKKGSDAWKQLDAQVKKNNKTLTIQKGKLKETKNQLKTNEMTATQLRRRIRDLSKSMDGMSKKLQPKQWEKHNKELQKTRQQYDKVRASGQKLEKSSGGLITKLKGLLPALGPAAIIAGIISITTKLFGMAKALDENRRKVAQLTDAFGEELDTITSKVQATATTFNKDFNEVLKSGNNFAKQMKIPIEEAMDIINKGFSAGADSSGEFLDMLKEYGPQFKEAGYSAEEAVAIMTQQVKSGVFSDKGVDTIKEATIRLREMTPATQEALNGIGLSSDKIQQSLRDGSLSVQDVIAQVSEKLGELPEQSTEVGTAIADIFGGPGEDAGLAFIKTLKDMDSNLDNLVDASGKFGKQQLELVKINEKIEKSKNELFGSEESWFGSVKLGWKKLVLVFFQGIENIRNWIKNISNTVSEFFQNRLMGTFKNIGKSFGSIFKSLGESFNNIKVIFKPLINIFSKLREKLGLYNEEQHKGQLAGKTLSIVLKTLVSGLRILLQNVLLVVEGFKTLTDIGKQTFNWIKSGFDKELRPKIDLSGIKKTLSGYKDIVKDTFTANELEVDKSEESSTKKIEKETDNRKKLLDKYTDYQKTKAAEASKATISIYDKELKALEKATTKKRLLVKQQYLNGELDEQQYQEKLKLIQVAYLKNKKELLEKHGKDTLKIEEEIYNASITFYNEKKKNEEKHQKEIQDIIKKYRIDEQKATIEEELAILDKAYDDKLIKEEEYQAARNLIIANSIRTKRANSGTKSAQGAADTLLNNGVISGDEYNNALDSVAAAESFASNESTFDQLDEVDSAESTELEMQQALYEEGLISFEEYEKAKTDIQSKYSSQRQEMFEKGMNDMMSVIDAFGNLFAAQKDAELAKVKTNMQRELKAAEGNEKKQAQIREKYEQKKKVIMKKYADKEFAVKVAQIIASGAQAIMQAFAQLGPIAGPIAATLIGATTALQIDSANQQREQVKQLYSGQYPRYTVVGKDDGKIYDNIPYFGSVNQTGIPNHGHPTIINERGGEMVFTADHTRDLLANQSLFNQVMDLPSAPQRAVGNYPEPAQADQEQSQQTSQRMEKLMEMNISLLQRLDERGIRAYMPWTDHVQQHEEYDKIISNETG